MTTDLLTLLQFTDGLFPAGGFAHSFGLETYTQSGVVNDAAGLQAFLEAHLEGSLGPADAVAVAVANRAAACGDLAACLALDARVDAMKWVPELAAASRQMGRQTARVAAAIGGDAFLVALSHAIDEGRAVGHHAVLFGAVTGRARVDVTTAAAAFIYASAAMIVNAALRLVPLGQLEGQRLLATLRPRIARLADAAAAADIDAMWSFMPGIEIASIEHASLDMRLFRS